VPFVLLVVGSDFTLSLLEYLNFKATFTWPLFAKVFVKFLDRPILQVLDFLSNFLLVQLLFSHEPGESFAKTLFEDLHDAIDVNREFVCHRGVTFWITWWLHLRLLQVVIWLEWGTVKPRW
jgi:hypothetical protein